MQQPSAMPRFAANLTMLFTELSFLDRFAAASRAGFDAVEFLFPYDYPADAVAEAAAGAGVLIAMFNLPPGDWAAGERGIAALPGREADFARTLDVALKHAGGLGVTKLHAMAGLVASGADAETYAANLARACAAARHITFLIEPISAAGVPGYWLDSMERALGVIETVGAPNLTLQFDLFHAAMMDVDAPAFIDRHIDRIGHVQIAGAPGRQEPDTGTTDHALALRRLDALGYAGWVGAEYNPAGRTEDGLDWRERLA